MVQQKSYLLCIYFVFFSGTLSAESVVFAHGTGTIGVKQAEDYKPTRIFKNNRFSVTHPNAVQYHHALLLNSDVCTGPNFADTGSLDKTGNWRKAYWGQEKNARELAGFINKDKPQIVMGTSRGCAAIMRSLEYVPAFVQNEIKLIYFESPYARVVDCVEYIAKQRGEKSGLKGFVFRKIAAMSDEAKMRIFNWTHNGWGFDRNDLQKAGSPVDQINYLPRHATVMIVATMEDKVVPVSSSARLYLAIRERCPNCYFVVLRDGAYGNKTFLKKDGTVELEKSHDNQVNMAEAVAAQDVMQALRKRQDLHHDAIRAAIGEGLLTGQKIPDYASRALILTNLQPDQHALVRAGVLK